MGCHFLLQGIFPTQGLKLGLLRWSQILYQLSYQGKPKGSWDVVVKSLIYVSDMWASLVVQTLKRLPAMWETWVQSLGWEDPLEKEMATHSSILAWRIPWTEELSGL